MMQEICRALSYRTILAATFILSLLPLLILLLFPAQFEKKIDSNDYLVFHNITEFFSIMVSLSIFGVTWYTYGQSQDRHALFLGTAFLAIGLLDFMHASGNAAMPAFITPNSANKSTQFWLAARLFGATAFLISAYVYPEKQSRWLSRSTLMTGALAVSGLVFTGITFFPSYVPATFVPGIGLTPFKKISECLVILLLILAGIAYWKRMAKTGNRLLIYYLAAFIVCIFSEAVFASYKRTFDTYNVLGHIYKIVAFFLMYKGIFATSVKGPYVTLTVANEKLGAYARKLERMNDELQEFFFVASHDLQEPLRKIHMFSGLLSKKYHDMLGEDGRGHISRVTKEANRMSDLIRSLLSYARLSSETKPFEPTDLAEVLQTTLRHLEPAITKTEGKVEIGMLPVIDADSAQMRQLFQNLLDNSLKFCPESRKPVIKVYGQANGETYQIKVEDNGIGFDEQFSELILKPFQRLHNRTSKYGGTGIGLTICRKIVDRHGGKIAVHSTPGEGATFVVTLPVKQP